MKTLFIEAKYDKKIDFPKTKLGLLPKKIVLLTTVQFLDQLPDIKKTLKRCQKEVIIPKGVHSKYLGQILGCGLIEPILEAKDAECFLYIGDGLFHPKQLLLKNNLPVFVFNPKTNDFLELKKEDITILQKRIKGALLKFLSTNNIGILVSTKPGQNKFELAKKLKSKLKKENKNAFIFICDTIDFNEIENFPFIDVFINTACPRIAYDDYEKIAKPIIDFGDLPDEYKKNN